MSYREQVVKASARRAEADRAEALVSLSIMLDHPAGIGDHSTTDLHNNLNEALAKLADAEDRLETIDRHNLWQN